MKAVSLSGDWQPFAGTPGAWFSLLSGDFDEAGGRGFRTRLVKYDPGTYTGVPFVHVFWEDAYLLEGEMVEGETNQHRYTAPAYVIRPPGTSHGPFFSKAGCLLLEIQYFASRSLGKP